jgi:hypothetical protein
MFELLLAVVCVVVVWVGREVCVVVVEEVVEELPPVWAGGAPELVFWAKAGAADAAAMARHRASAKARRLRHN